MTKALAGCLAATLTSACMHFVDLGEIGLTEADVLGLERDRQNETLDLYGRAENAQITGIRDLQCQQVTERAYSCFYKLEYLEPDGEEGEISRRNVALGQRYSSNEWGFVLIVSTQ